VWHKWKTCGQSNKVCPVKHTLEENRDIRLCASCTKWRASKYALESGQVKGDEYRGKQNSV